MIVDHPVISLQCRNSAPLFRGCRGKRLPFETPLNELGKEFIFRRPAFVSGSNNLLGFFFDDNFIHEGLLRLGLFCNRFLCNILCQLWGIVITSYQLWGTVIILCQLWGIVITSYQLWGTVIIPYQLWGIVITCYLFSIICSRLFSLNLSLFFSCFFLYCLIIRGYCFLSGYFCSTNRSGTDRTRCQDHSQNH